MYLPGAESQNQKFSFGRSLPHTLTYTLPKPTSLNYAKRTSKWTVSLTSTLPDTYIVYSYQ